MHPVTYVNKLLFFGGKTMELWNIQEMQMIYAFSFSSEVECVVQSPVIDIVSVGCRDGSIHMVNLLYDEVLFTFKHREGAINSISFLTDSKLELSLMASTSHESGSIVFWDLNAKKIWNTMEAPHSGNSVTFL